MDQDFNDYFRKSIDSSVILHETLPLPNPNPPTPDRNPNLSPPPHAINWPINTVMNTVSDALPLLLVTTHVKFPLSRCSANWIVRLWLQCNLLYRISCVALSGAPLNSHVTMAAGLDLTEHVMVIVSSVNTVFPLPFMVTTGGPGNTKLVNEGLHTERSFLTVKSLLSSPS